MRKLWKELDKTADLFEYWHHELNMRQAFRDDFTMGQTITIDNVEQIEFLYRSLFLIGRPEEFFQALIPNLDKSTLLNWLKNSRPAIILHFLEFLPPYIKAYKPRPEQLVFLIHIYNQKHNYLFMPIADTLTTNHCQYIINKTANPEFRKLLKKRLTNLEEAEKSLLEEIDLTKSNLPYSTIYGDKVELIISTLTLQAKAQIITTETKNSRFPITEWLSIATNLFALGLIEECLQLLLSLYKNYYYDFDASSVKILSKLVLKTVPMYVLLHGLFPFNRAKQIYNTYFPAFDYDRASLEYLQLYEELRLMTNDFTTNILNLYPPILKISQLRGEKLALIIYDEITSGLSTPHFNQVIQLVQDKLTSFPHEAFIILELLRNLLKHDGIKETINKDDLATNYLHLYRWLPNSIFLNEDIIVDLITNTSLPVREQLEKILKFITYYNNKSILTEVEDKPDLFKLKTEELRRILLTGEILGGVK